MVNAQEWLEQNYPDKKTRTIYLNQQLAGVLDCREYKDLEYIFISSSVDSNKLEIKKGSYEDWEGEKQKTKIKNSIPAQNYLNRAYSTKEKEEMKNLLIKNTKSKGLEGNLDLSDFINLETLDCYDNYLTNLNLNNCWKLKKIICFDNQFTTLKASNLERLETLRCSDNYLTQIIYPPQPERITELDISNNNLNSSNLTIFSQFRNLEKLKIGNWDKIKINQNVYNHFYGSLEPLKDLNELEYLDISNTDLDSGWEYLPDSLEYFVYDTQLRPNCKLSQVQAGLEKELWIDIHQDFSLPKYKKDWLAAGFSKEQTQEWIVAGAKPNGTEFINWFLNFKKLDLDWACENEEEFRELRDKYGYFGTCEECRQLNVSMNWCQSCNAKHFQAKFNTWTSGNPNIDQFIQKCQKEATSPWNVLEWIPYEKFKNIEPIAEGGFGKVYKARWKGGTIWGWDNKKREWVRKGDGFKDYKTVALKTLFNSQNLNHEFLAELTLYKMFRSSVSQMVPCYGISRDTKGNYIMVMEYMREGNLRDYLRKNIKELNFKSKLNFLKQITQGLKDIHRKHLVHRDFHSGNIVLESEYNCRITDLGLSKPVSKTETEDKIYGLMPYVAPEVLKGEPYTQKADIYSLGMVMYEVITGLPPYAEQSHDTNLALMILQGIRPSFSNHKTPKQVRYPQILVDLIEKCWEPEPNDRSSAREISNIVGEWFEEEKNYWEGLQLKTDTELYRQLQAAEAFNRTLPDEIKYPTYHSSETWHSKPINTKQITDLLTSQSVTLDLGNLSIQNPQEESSQQAQVEIPPK